MAETREQYKRYRAAYLAKKKRKQAVIAGVCIRQANRQFKDFGARRALGKLTAGLAGDPSNKRIKLCIKFYELLIEMEQEDEPMLYQ